MAPASSDAGSDLDDGSISAESADVVPPPLWSSAAHFRLTRRGKILKSVSEKYLRDDLGLGFHIAPSSTGSDKGGGDGTNRRRGGGEGKVVEIQTAGPARRIGHGEELLGVLARPGGGAGAGGGKSRVEKKLRLAVCDANVLLHNLDVLEHPSRAVSNVAVPQTALAECRHRSLAAYGRAVELLRSSSPRRAAIFFPDGHHVEAQAGASPNGSINDRNDRTIRRVCELYGAALRGTGVEVVLLTDDAGCRQLAAEEQRGGDGLYKARSVREHVRELEGEDPSLCLSDVVAQSTAGGPAAGAAREKNVYFPPHLPQGELSLGVKAGRYYQGFIRAERGCSDRFYVTVRRGDERVAVTILGTGDANRAVDGDVVAVELNPVDKWIGGEGAGDGGGGTGGGNGEKRGKNAGGAGIASETAEPTVRDQDNVQDAVPVPSAAADDAVSLKRPTGKVVGIVRRNFRQNYCGSVYSAAGRTSKRNERDEAADSDGEAADAQAPRVRTERDGIAEACEADHPDGTSTSVFFAVDPRLPPVLLRTCRRDQLLGRRILVAIDSWPADSPHPLGHYVRTLGESGLKDVETEVLLHEHDIPCDPFPAKVLACLPPEDYKIGKDGDGPERLDLRHLPVLSIDPPGCKDIDDALHCTVLPNGNYQVGVHIADVTNYVKAGTAIDLEAANRSTSTYLVNKRLDMLPKLLTTDLCSLKGNVDRYAFSVLWEVTPEADIIDVDFRKSIIHSIAALTYQQAQGLIDQPDDPDDVQAGAVKRLASLARKFRARRIDAGALTLASPEVKFVLDSESLNPTDVQAYALFEANALVEEFMLLANVTVSKKILRHYPTLSVLRRHPAPNRAMFESLISKAKSRGFDVDIDDSKRLADSLDAAVLPSDPYFNKLLRILSTRCMSPAQYFCSGEYSAPDWHHYGLAAPVYTHFTSPIRRYADVCVHRLLAAAIGVDPLPVHLSSKSYLHDLCANMNRRHRAAQLAGRASVQLHTLLFFAGEAGGKVEEAYVLDVDTSERGDGDGGEPPSFTVIVPRYGIEGRVKLGRGSDDDAGGEWKRDAERHRIEYRWKDPASGEGRSASVTVFEKVRVRIWVRTVQENQRELVLDLVSPVFGSEGRVREGEESGASGNELVTATGPDEGGDKATGVKSEKRRGLESSSKKKKQRKG